jgi:predicted DsbA family dithiol-disulfide isomerase
MNAETPPPDDEPIEIYADIWCPFTHVGLTRLLSRRSGSSVTPRFRIHPWALEIVNGAPLDPDFVAEEIDALTASVAPDLFRGFSREHFPRSTLAALSLVETAYDIGLEEGEAIGLALRAVLFEEGRDIADRAVLDATAAGLGLPRTGDVDRDAIERSLEAGRARGVVGSPHFFTSRGDYFCPALDIRRVDGSLRISENPEMAERLASECFGPEDPSRPASH